jgi:homoserine kinase
MDAMDPTSPAALRACAVRVPCSTSNLGAGFDCIGLAFRRYLYAGFEPGDGGDLRIQRGGTLRGLDLAPGDDLLTAAFIAELRRHGAGSAAGSLAVASEIPVSAGLGSSAAAVVAGIALAAAACGRTLNRDAALAAAALVEGHPDNAGPALFGGLVAVSHTTAGMPRALRMPLSDRIAFVFAAPDAAVSTARARAALPAQVPHVTAVRGAGRMAALLYGLAHADAGALAAGFDDELHVPYRLPLIPGGADALGAATGAGAWAATISGSGSGIIAACPPGRAEAVLHAMRQAFADAGRAGAAFIATPDAHGVQPHDPAALRALLST